MISAFFQYIIPLTVLFALALGLYFIFGGKKYE